MITVIWHLVFVIVARRGRSFFKEMIPARDDFVHFFQRIMYNLGRRETTPRYKRFNYVEKAEYWALVWGTIVMVVTGILLWFDNWFVQFLPKGVLDVALVIHYWEAWLATLAIVIWHFYSTVFNPHVYPMNPSWLTGKMPEEMYQHEHPEHLEEARKEMEAEIRKELRDMGAEGDERPES
jgi:cytochrome b subunit of formate dehydrogenase